MGLKRVRVDSSPFVGGGEVYSEKGRPSGITIGAIEIVTNLQEVCPGVHADWGGRHNLVHPYMEMRQGLFYFHKHVCSMDRDRLRQWPEWSVTEELVEVPIEHAIFHDDLPIVAFNEKGEARIEEQDTAYVMRMKPDRCLHVGWAEVFYRVLKYPLPGVNREWIERTFGVSMQWMDTLRKSPLDASFQQIERRTIGERVVNLCPAS